MASLVYIAPVMTSKEASPRTGKTKKWSIKDSDKLYNISRWGDGYFGINKKGNLSAYPDRDQESGPAIDIYEVLEEVKQLNIDFPVVLRFQDILRSRVEKLNKIFKRTIKEAKYKGKYFGVFPIKVNQMREVVEEILAGGLDYNFGLEAGSKTELLAALALNENNKALTILNGYKDEEYFRLALLGMKLGRKVIVVIEKPSELKEILRLGKEMGVEPNIGIRARVSSEGSGKWKESSGELSKFGLSMPEIVNALEELKAANALSCLKLFHFHIGSQITDIRKIKDAVTEGARIYAQLTHLGAKIDYFDVGGGLGIDYDGSKSVFESSRNYSTVDYVEDVVYILRDICDQENVEHPHLVSESGRYISAHHSCVVFNVFGKVQVSPQDYKIKKSDNQLVKQMLDLKSELCEDNFQETYNDVLLKKDECLQSFKLGILSLEDRAAVESLFWSICREIYSISLTQEYVPDEIKKLQSKLADQFLCNFSIFQSLADSWGVGQLFPISPIHKLNTKPEKIGTLADITCDSDGKISNFIDFSKSCKTLPMHEICEDGPYYMGVFLTGAYQDIMGDMHNLFGRVNEIHVFSDEEDPNQFYIEEIIHGNSCSDILKTVQYNPDQMSLMIKRELNQKVREGELRPRESVHLANFYEKCLNQYSYLTYTCEK